VDGVFYGEELLEAFVFVFAYFSVIVEGDVVEAEIDDFD